LQLLLREAKYLDQLGGFELPHTATCQHVFTTGTAQPEPGITPRAQVLNVALQQDQYKVWVFVVEFLADDNDDDA
jgi:hypothetical protein